jgi:hypothetical protein
MGEAVNLTGAGVEPIVWGRIADAASGPCRPNPSPDTAANELA